MQQEEIIGILTTTVIEKWEVDHGGHLLTNHLKQYKLLKILSYNMFYLFVFTFFVALISFASFVSSGILLWWLLLLLIIPPWGWWGYRTIYVTRNREYEYEQIEKERRVRFNMAKNIIKEFNQDDVIKL